MNRQTQSNRLSNAENIGPWTLQVLTATAFLLDGFAALILSGRSETLNAWLGKLSAQAVPATNPQRVVTGSSRASTM
jgi:hypothetical protein